MTIIILGCLLSQNNEDNIMEMQRIEIRLRRPQVRGGRASRSVVKLLIIPVICYSASWAKDPRDWAT